MRRSKHFISFANDLTRHYSCAHYDRNLGLRLSEWIRLSEAQRSAIWEIYPCSFHSIPLIRPAGSLDCCASQPGPTRYSAILTRWPAYAISWLMSRSRRVHGLRQQHPLQHLRYSLQHLPSPSMVRPTRLLVARRMAIKRMRPRMQKLPSTPRQHRPPGAMRMAASLRSIRETRSVI